MKVPFPHRYRASVTRVGPSLATIEAAPRPSLSGGPPAEFQGDPHAWSPEHLLVSALGLCLFTTFEAFAAREHLAIHGWREITTGVLDRTSSGLAFQSFTIDVEITVDAADIERTREIVERAHRHCIISKALAVPVAVEPRIGSPDQRVPHEPASATA